MGFMKVSVGVDGCFGRGVKYSCYLWVLLDFGFRLWDFEFRVLWTCAIES